jgi:ribose 5-phosphate isomerase B
MKIAIGNDHRGYYLKKKIMLYLEGHGYEVIDCGTDTEDSVDYPIYAKKVANKILNKEATYGILICGTGIGMSIAANKIKGIRCAKVSNIEEAKLTRIDNDANILALSYKQKEVENIVDAFLTTETSLEERHMRRRNLIEELENDN